MNEFETIAWIAGLGAIIFGAVWVLMADCKRGINGRIKRCEHAIDVAVRDNHNFITVKAFDRFENNINNRLDYLTTRIDDFIIASRNGKKE